MKKQLLQLLLIAFTASVFAHQFSGNELASLVGKEANNPEVQHMIQSYQLTETVKDHYLCKFGVEMTVKGGKVFDIKLYATSPTYGDFKNQLPKGLVWGSSTEEVQKLLGKPTTMYQKSGYCEYDYERWVLTCWFEGGKLSAVSMTVKE